MTNLKFRAVFLFIFIYSLPTTHYSLTGEAAAFPSLFRGITVVDSPVGVRIVSVEENSQAALADVRPDDIIIHVNEDEVHSIDDFAMVSKRLKGHATSATLLVFRQGQPLELRLHLYSYPILKTWGIEVVPNFDVRFAETRIGLDYWRKQGQDFERAGDIESALDAYINALHNVPDELDTAVAMSRLFCQLSQRYFTKRQWREGVAALQQAVLMLEKLFDQPLNSQQLHIVKEQLQSVKDQIRQALASLSHPP